MLQVVRVENTRLGRARVGGLAILGGGREIPDHIDSYRSLPTKRRPAVLDAQLYVQKAKSLPQTASRRKRGVAKACISEAACDYRKRLQLRQI